MLMSVRKRGRVQLKRPEVTWKIKPIIFKLYVIGKKTKLWNVLRKGVTLVVCSSLIIPYSQESFKSIKISFFFPLSWGLGWK
jgi:hypothetical protein